MVQVEHGIVTCAGKGPDVAAHPIVRVVVATLLEAAFNLRGIGIETRIASKTLPARGPQHRADIQQIPGQDVVGTVNARRVVEGIARARVRARDLRRIRPIPIRQRQLRLAHRRLHQLLERDQVSTVPREEIPAVVNLIFVGVRPAERRMKLRVRIPPARIERIGGRALTQDADRIAEQLQAFVIGSQVCNVATRDHPTGRQPLARARGVVKLRGGRGPFGLRRSSAKKQTGPGGQRCAEKPAS